MKKYYFLANSFSKIFLLLLLFSFFISCSNDKDEKINQLGKSKKVEKIINIDSVNYIILRQWKPNNDPDGFGADILLKDDLSKDEIVSFIKQLAQDRNPVIIKIYLSQKAYDEQKTGKYDDTYKRDFLLVYVKNFSNKGAFKDFNEIRWMQEIGKFKNLFGKKTKL